MAPTVCTNPESRKAANAKSPAARARSRLIIGDFPGRAREPAVPLAPPRRNCESSGRAPGPRPIYCCRMDESTFGTFQYANPETIHWGEGCVGQQLPAALERAGAMRAFVIATES